MQVIFTIKMRRLVTLLIMVLSSYGALAQLEIKPDSFKEVEGFVNINPDPNYQSDDNNQPFAVIKVRTENITDKQRRELRFEGNAATFTLTEYKIGEVWVYITAKYADYIKISHPDFSTIEFALPCDLKPKCGYEMTLVNNAKTTDDEILERLKKLEESSKQEPKVVYVEKPAEQKPKTPTTPRKPWNTFVTLNFSNNMYNQAAFGFTVGTMRKVGVFLTFMTDGVFTNVGEEDKWDHMKAETIQVILDENPSYRAERSYVSMSVIGGVIFKVYGPLNVKIGGGYSNTSLWVKMYDISDNRIDYWVSDYSSYGFGGLLGLQAHFGHFAVSLDGATTNFKVFEGRIGLGYVFGKKQ